MPATMKTLGLLLLGFLLMPSLIQCLDEKGQYDKFASSALSKKLGEDNIVLSLMRSVVELASNGFKTGLEASVRSLFNKPVTSAVYALSMLVGVVAMLAFYESPISPVPVPPLPDPPVGRFPPEHPIWPPPKQGQQAGGMPYRGQMPYRSQQHPYQQRPDNHRSDTHTVLLTRNKALGSGLLPTHLNETSYNNYISKLTSVLDLNNNPNAGSALEQFKHAYTAGSELSNKVIDYKNKRMSVESLKYSNNTQRVA